MEPVFFTRLLELPLFLGIGRNEVWEIVEKVRFEFRKYPAGKLIVRQDEPCTGLIFVINGELSSCRQSDTHSYTLREWRKAPQVIQPASLFGLTMRYSRDYLAETDVDVLFVDKRAVRDILFGYTTFRLNYLNMLSFQIQQYRKGVWNPLAPDLRHRFADFLKVRCEWPAGRKELNIKMEDLADELDATRLNISRMLKSLQQQELISLRREKIIIPAFQKILQSRVVEG